MQHRRLERLCHTPPRRQEARQAARARPRQLCRILDRLAEGAGRRSTCGRKAASTWSSAPSRAARATRRASRRSSSDLLAVPVETVQIILGDTDMVQGRRRLAFRPLHAPCRDRVFQGRRRPDRQGQEDRRADRWASRRTPSSSPDGRFVSRDTNRSFDFFELAKEAPRARPAGRSRRAGLPSSPTTRCTIRCFPTAARSARSRSIPIPA